MSVNFSPKKPEPAWQSNTLWWWARRQGGSKASFRRSETARERSKALHALSLEQEEFEERIELPGEGAANGVLTRLPERPSK